MNTRHRPRAPLEANMRTSDPDDPINALYGEHDAALEHLELLGSTGREMAREGPTAPRLAAFEKAVAFLDSEIRAHNEWEEVHLFPRLEAAMGPGGPCMVMRAEHRELWDHYGTLGPLLAAVREGRAGEEGVKQLSRVADAIESLLSAHIAKENDILFPMARRFLTAEDMVALKAARPAA